MGEARTFIRANISLRTRSFEAQSDVAAGCLESALRPFPGPGLSSLHSVWDLLDGPVADNQMISGRWVGWVWNFGYWDN
jgi:hypothetical protein